MTPTRPTAWIGRVARRAALLPAALLASPALADPDKYGGYGDHMMWGYGGGLIGGLFMLVFWGALIAVIVLAVRWLSDGSSGSSGQRRGGDRSTDALEILRQRLARGEIDPEEYAARRKVLEE